MSPKVRFSPEEKKMDMEDTLEMLKQGIGQNEIARQLGRSYQYISDIKVQLVSSGAITQAQIDEAKEKVRKEAIDAKELKKAKEQQEMQDRLDSVCKEILKGTKTTIQISRDLRIPMTTLRGYISILTKQGRITEGDIKHQSDQLASRNALILADVKSGNYKLKEVAAKYGISPSSVFKIIQKSKQSAKVKPHKRRVKDHTIDPNAILSYKEKEVKNWILKGYQYLYIAQKMNITEFEVSKIVASLRKNHAINSEMIKKAREEKRKRDDDLIIEHLKKGISPNAMPKLLEQYQVGDVYKALRRLKEENRITDEEIESALIDHKYNSLKELVLSGMKQGLIMREIIASDETRICYRESCKTYD